MCSSTTISCIEHLAHRRPGQDHRWTSSFGACLAVHTEDPAGDHPYVVATRLDPHTPPMLSAAYNRRRCGPIIALRPRELPLTPGTKRQVQTHVWPVIRRDQRGLRPASLLHWEEGEFQSPARPSGACCEGGALLSTATEY